MRDGSVLEASLESNGTVSAAAVALAMRSELPDDTETINQLRWQSILHSHT